MEKVTKKQVILDSFIEFLKDGIGECKSIGKNEVVLDLDDWEYYLYRKGYTTYAFKCVLVYIKDLSYISIRAFRKTEKWHTSRNTVSVNLIEFRILKLKKLL